MEWEGKAVLEKSFPDAVRRMSLYKEGFSGHLWAQRVKAVCCFDKDAART